MPILKLEKLIKNSLDKSYVLFITNQHGVFKSICFYLKNKFDLQITLKVVSKR